MEMQFLVEECDCLAVGPAASVDTAMRMIGEDGLSAALLDINLGGEMVWPVAEALDKRQVPYILVSGFDRSKVPPRFAGRPFLTKPVHQKAVHRELAAMGLCEKYSPLPHGGPLYPTFGERQARRRPMTKH